MNYQRVHAVNQLIPPAEVLSHFGTVVHHVPMQVRCPVHKGGQENTPSARLFEDSIWCYTCSKHYHATDIWTVAKGVSLETAVEQLISKWDLSEEEIKAVKLEFDRERSENRIYEIAKEEGEQCLIQYRGKVPLDVYRTYARELDDLSFENDGDDDQKLLKVRLLNKKIRKNLNPFLTERNSVDI